MDICQYLTINVFNQQCRYFSVRVDILQLDLNAFNQLVHLQNLNFHFHSSQLLLLLIRALHAKLVRRHGNAGALCDVTTARDVQRQFEGDPGAFGNRERHRKLSGKFGRDRIAVRVTACDGHRPNIVHQMLGRVENSGRSIKIVDL